MVVVAEGDNAYFECSISANPITPDMIRWSTKGGNVILRENQQFTENGRSILTLFNVTKQDSGSFECEAYNGILIRMSKRRNLWCCVNKPTIIRNLMNTKLAAELKSTIELKCIAEGDGNISFVWSFNSTVIIQGLDIGRYDIRSAYTGDLQWCSVLTIKRELPSRPQELKAVNETMDAITLVWSAGFDGGAGAELPDPIQEVGLRHLLLQGGPHQTPPPYTITGLEPGAQYDFFIAAYNSMEKVPSLKTCSRCPQRVLNMLISMYATVLFAAEVTTSAAVTMSAAEKTRRADNRMWLMSSILGGVSFLVSCICCVCCIWRKCSLLTSEMIIPIAQLQAAQEEAHGDICNRLLIQPEPKQTPPVAVGVQNESVQEQVQLRDLQAEQQQQPQTRTLSWEDTARSEYSRTRSLSFDRGTYANAEEATIKDSIGSVNNIHAASTERSKRLKSALQSPR
ncbi:nephrin [Caerostris extrusa]|uniref:Nephrin n=1 Tax=Caerostris extrusa TaxID=172846 RepID=A0AAV4WVI1_CAEEX|nr:nephrin [Caerostris extrusa]